MAEFLLKPSLAIPAALLVIYVVYAVFVRSRTLRLPDLPWLNERPDEWFSKTRAKWRCTVNYKAAIEDAYENYSKNEKSCILSKLGGTVIILPASAATWIVNQPDEVLSVLDPHIDELQTDLTYPDPSILRYPTHHHVIQVDLARQVGNLTGKMMDELSSCIDETWGVDTSSWTTICVFENLMNLIARTTNRVFVGLPLCRNKEYLSCVAGFAQDVPLSATILRLFPASLRPLVAVVVTLPNKYHIRKYTNLVRPEVEKRITASDLKQADPENKGAETDLNDYLQWSVNYAKKSLPASESRPEILAARVLGLNFAAIHTSTFTLTSLIFDLVSTDPKERCIEQLREEVETVLAEEGGHWTKRGVQKMHKIDSAYRESLRINSFMPAGLQRQVVAADGITTPQGIHCPKGSYIAMPAYGVHNDPTIFPDADKFVPFRFANLKDQVDIAGGAESHLQKNKYSFVTTGPEYLPFGHGKHACTGRFFASIELKLMAAYMVLHYDFEMLSTRPENKWFSSMLLPPMKATIRVRRRKE